MKCGNRSTFALLAVGLAFAGIAKPATSQTVVLPNANTSVSGTADTVIPFSEDPWTFQWEFAASQFGSVPVGTEITSIGFRLRPGANTGPASPLNFSQWNLQLSTPQLAFSNLSTTFANNIGGDVVTVKSGPLTIPANALTGGAGPNPFYDIAFDTPYTYTGGDLLLTLRQTGNGATFPELDANPVTDGLSNTVGSNSSATATSGLAHFFNYPITLLDFHTAASVPEPGTIGFLVAFLVPGAALGIRRLRRS